MSKIAFSDTYEFIEYKSEDELLEGALKVTDGDYKDLVYRYGLVQFKENEGQMIMNFQFEILENPHEVNTEDNGGLIDYMGDVLCEIMEEELQNPKDVVEYKEEQFDEKMQSTVAKMKSEIEEMRDSSNESREQYRRETDPSEPNSE
jgi:hypothetical protein|tara:strand:+ start:2109 stop:2549 length:441 start_codon:yes stop_codon:yes gene_type:complete